MRRTSVTTIGCAAAGLLLALAACEGWDQPVGGMGPADAPVIPPVRGYAAGQEILFIHPEASDPAIADTLTAMMDSPVLVVPELARVPEEALAEVYVFTNGVEPGAARGPLGFQPDVFDCAPGTACYSPLRRVNLVTWTDAGSAEVLASAGAVDAAVETGELTVERPGVVVNMPFLEWPEGER